MSFFDDFTGASALDAINDGYRDSRNLLDTASTNAGAALNRGNTQANALLRGSNRTLGVQNRGGQALLRNAGQQATGYFQPYMQSGAGANALYSSALGVNGTQAQQEFGQNYAASDPFRAQNAGFATDALLQGLNARGLSGSGYAAEAVARQNLMRGSDDYGNYLNRLSGLSQSGQNAAAGAAGVATGTAANRANLGQQYAGLQNLNTNTRAGNQYNTGNNMMNLIYGNAQQQASLRNQQANAQAAASQTGINNLLSLAGTAASFF